VKLKQFLLLGGILLGATLVGASPVGAYSLEGPIWSGQPSPGTCCAKIYYRNNAVHSAVLVAGSNAATAWNNSPGLVLFDTSLSFHFTYDEADNSSVGWDGLTSWTTYKGSNGVTYFKSMSVQVNYYYSKNYTSGQTQSVSAHEFGHALGLGHSSACVLMNGYTNIRYSSSCNYINTPLSDEINGVNALY
jgi:hypothetical protein